MVPWRCTCISIPLPNTDTNLLLWNVLLSPHFPSLSFTDLQDRCDYHVATNDNFNVPLNYLPKPEEQLRWMHKGSVIFDRKGAKLVKGNKDDVYQNGSLKLTNLDKNKAGIYTPEIYDKGKPQGDVKSVAVCVQGR